MSGYRAQAFAAGGRPRRLGPLVALMGAAAMGAGLILPHAAAGAPEGTRDLVFLDPGVPVEELVTTALAPVVVVGAAVLIALGLAISGRAGPGTGGLLVGLGLAGLAVFAEPALAFLLGSANVVRLETGSFLGLSGGILTVIGGALTARQ